MAENEALPDDTPDYHGSLSIAGAAEAVVAAIKSSHGYLKYVEAYNNLSSGEIEAIRAFKRAEAELPPSGGMSFEDEKRVSYLYTALNLNKSIKSFIEKERAVCGALTEAFEIIGGVGLFMFDD